MPATANINNATPSVRSAARTSIPRRRRSFRTSAEMSRRSSISLDPPQARGHGQKALLERGRGGRDPLHLDAVLEQTAQERCDDLAIDRRLLAEGHADRALVVGGPRDA